MEPQSTQQESPEESGKAQGPLDRLCTLLKEDMDAVNSLILQRMDSPVDMIPKLAAYLIAAGGKRVRPLLTLACTKLYEGDMTRACTLAAAVEFIHTATLLHDDVVDGSPQRRGQKAANLVFGNQASVLVGDFLFSRAFQLMTEDGSLDILRILSGTSAIIAQGEVMQLAATGEPDLSMDRYIEIIRAKTAALFSAACEVGPVIANAERTAAAALAEYGLNLGIAFQIADDALDYTMSADKAGKEPGNDFREGKMTAPVILAMQQASGQDRRFWQKTFKTPLRTPEDLEEAQSILRRCGAVEQALDMARTYGEKARLALAEAPDCPLRAVLDDLVAFAVERRY